MLITLSDGVKIQGSEIVSATLRSSLEPVPLTFECQVKLNEQYAGGLLEGSVLKVGKEQTPVKIVFARDTVAPWNDGDIIQVREVIALHENSAGIADTLSRAVIRENISLSEIYQSCGGKSEVQKSFAVPRFYAYKGSVPSRLIAYVCQEHGGVVRWIPEYNRLSFERITDLFSQQPKGTRIKNVDTTFKSGFIVNQEVAKYISTDSTGNVIQSQGDISGAVVFTPNKTQAQLNAMQKVLLNAKEIPCDFSPDVHAGDLLEFDGVKMVVVTAAHVWRLNETGVLENLSVFWLGVKGF